jgi:putative inorganic carbon (hco3(-)) transporter
VQSNQNNLGQQLSKWIHTELLIKKLSSIQGLIFLITIASFCGYLAVQNLSIIPLLVAGGLAGASVVYFCLFKPLQGYYVITFIAFFAFYPNHILNIEVPLSTGVEVLVVFLLLGTVLAAKGDPNQKGDLFKISTSIAFLVYTLYFVVELFNPNMGVLTGWIFTLKRFTVTVLIYIISYRLINTPQRLKFFFKFWISMAFIAAAYGCYQQWFGLLPMEMKYIMKNPLEFKLLSQGGNIRKFSFLSDVVSFGILSGSVAVISLILAVNEKNTKKRNWYIFATIIMILGMLYAGTRTTTIILPAGVALYSLMTLQKKSTLITVFFTLAFSLFIIFVPIDTPVLNRLRSTFDSKEASMDVRNVNRHYIQPYIYAHPIGGGVSSSGVEGIRFNPTHRLAGFPPDSGLLKAAIETGGIGLFLTLLFNAVILYQGIYYYFRMKSEVYKKYLVALVASLFTIIVTQYSQVTIGQIPGIFFFFSAMSLTRRLFEFDLKERDTTNN